MATITESGRTQQTAWTTLRRGLALSPEFTAGLTVTLLLALGSTVGRVLVPIAVQQTIDNGLLGAGGPDVARVRDAVTLASVAVLGTALCAYLLNVRLFRTTESGLATLRVRAFRHVHDLSVLTQNAERRGSLVSRVTSDVDTISTFMQWGGLLMVVSGPWRAGLMVVGATFVVAALARVVVPAEHVGMLRVRGKAFDIFWTTTLGISLCLLALLVPPGPT